MASNMNARENSICRANDASAIPISTIAADWNSALNSAVPVPIMR